MDDKTILKIWQEGYEKAISKRSNHIDLSIAVKYLANKVEEQARASERKRCDGILQERYHTGWLLGIRKGQFELIKKLKSAQKAAFGYGGLYARIEKIIEASESLSRRRGTSDETAIKPENAFELQYCEIHNQMTNHINEVCQKCKPEKPCEFSGMKKEDCFCCSKTKSKKVKR